MPIRSRPGRPSKGEIPSPQRRRVIYMPTEIDKDFVQLAKDEGTNVHALMRRILLEWWSAKKGPGLP
jgi:hypothetical protein